MDKNNVEIIAIKKYGLLSSKKIQQLLKISQPTLSRLVKNGDIIKFSYDLYAHPKTHIPPETIDFAIACTKFGKSSAIAGLSALFHYGLVDQAPNQVWVVVPPSKSNNNKMYKCIRTKISFKYGIEVHEHYKITSIERTILEALKLGEKIGLRIGINAARTALQRGLTTEKRLGEMAKSLKLRSIFEKYWEAIVT